MGFIRPPSSKVPREAALAYVGPRTISRCGPTQRLIRLPHGVAECSSGQVPRSLDVTGAGRWFSVRPKHKIDSEIEE